MSPVNNKPQYSKEHRELLAKYGVIQSGNRWNVARRNLADMKRRGHSAVSESFFATLKTEYRTNLS